MLSVLGQASRACDGITRRRLLEVAGAGLLGTSFARLAAAETRPTSRVSRARSVIFLFLYGGPSQLETFDMKPAAPDAIRGPFQPIASRTPELRICEHLPRTALVSDKFCVVRTLTHPYNDHSSAGHYIQTGHPWPIPIGAGFNATPNDWPSMGSIAQYTQQSQSAPRKSARGRTGEMPGYVVLPNSLGRLQEGLVLRRPGEYAGWLGAPFEPLTTAIDKKTANDNPYWRNCDDAELQFQIQGLAGGKELALDRLSGRRSLVDQLDVLRHTLDRGRAVDGYDDFEKRALALVTSGQARRALDIRAESAATRDRYGRHLFGQATLMGRRLIEAGVRFVTVHYDCVDGYSWDSHVSSHDVKNHLLPTFDQAYSALLTDLDERGLLGETLVVALGEMGRTPRATPQWGRGHWSTLFSVLLAGAGVRGGTVYGTSDAQAAYPLDHPTRPEDLAATILDALGIDPEMRIPNSLGRPVSLVDNAQKLDAIFG
ncbi:MAG TPA: DUF1501 domain-containing protein [Planctomycetaceae bacterium]|jgi:hypothetical protein|nr:DUF1501 domain-containing protein [Planctomycetaceae bacterium]